ncbi:hypothetical protein EMIT0P12_20554 [Pseudomonas sp. IT-P12]
MSPITPPALPWARNAVTATLQKDGNPIPAHITIIQITGVGLVAASARYFALFTLPKVSFGHGLLLPGFTRLVYRESRTWRKNAQGCYHCCRAWWGWASWGLSSGCCCRHY